MSSFIYTNFLAAMANADADWNGSTVIRLLLERSTSTYSPNRDHQFLSSFTGGGGVEISVASYARQSTASRTTTANTTADQVELGAANVAFGNLESGQTVKAVLGYIQTGGNDSTPADDTLAFYFDGTFDLILAANAAAAATTIYVDPLPADIASGTALNFGGGATGTLAADALQGARSITLSGGGLGASASAGATSTNVQQKTTGVVFPFALGGGAFQFNPAASGLIRLINNR